MQQKLFYLLILFLPLNLAKHFILPSSFVSGFLVDYLIPAVYLTDIIILALILPQVKQLSLKLFRSPLLPFLLLLLPSVFSATSIIPAAYKWLKYLELAYFSLWIRANISKKHLPAIIKTLALAVVLQSLLALGQWYKQGSVLSYFPFGEQPYTTATAGVDRITWLDGSLKMPPLGTTPHPNILGGFLAVTLPLIYPLPIFWLGIIPLFLTFSLSSWLAFLLIGVPAILFRKLGKIRPKLSPLLISAGVFLIVMSLAFQLEFLSPPTSFSRRSQLTQMALAMFADKPLTGVGLNNFTVVMDQYGLVPATTRFLQPVHNIFLLVLSESGLVGLLGFIFLLVKHKRLGVSILTLLFIGLFDHYPLTVQQGLLLFTLFLSLI